MTYNEDFDELGEKIEVLESHLGGIESFVSRFAQELGSLEGQLRQTQKETQGLTRAFGTSLKQAMDGVATDGIKLSDSLSALTRSLLNATYNAATKPVTLAASSAVTEGFGSLFPFASGGSFTQGRVLPFAKGDIVGSPTVFQMRGGAGLMGEAGPEAVMPLTRGTDGRLGVQASGSAAPISVQMHISTPDAQSFRRSRTQIAAEMSRALSHGARNR
nr:phage tail tape measure protein [uncultured Jannaschia sp.]